MRTSRRIAPLSTRAILSEPSDTFTAFVNAIGVYAAYAFSFVGAALLVFRANRVTTLSPRSIAQFMAGDRPAATIFTVAGLVFIALARLPSLRYALPFNP